MKLRVQSRNQLCAELGYLDVEGRLSDRKVADLIRVPLSRWGLSPKRTVLGYAREQLRVAGIEDVASVRITLQRLVDLGECEEVYVGNESYLAPAEPRWISIDDGVAAFLSVSQPPNGISVIDGTNQDIVRRIQIETDEHAAALQVAGVREISLAEWLVPLGYLSHARRRMRQPARSDALTLGSFWDLLEAELANGGLPLGDEVEVRMLSGCPGDFFGRHDTAEPEGRWETEAEEGVWFANRRGYGDGHWHPCIVAVDGDGKRVLDLYDWDEWRWAVLARELCLSPEEVVQAGDGRESLRIPLPNQLRAAMDIRGRPRSAWAWDVTQRAPDLWEMLMYPTLPVASEPSERE